MAAASLPPNSSPCFMQVDVARDLTTSPILNLQCRRRGVDDLELESMAASSSSGLTFKLYPLVVLNISDHHTRAKTQTQHVVVGDSALPSPPRVFGCVIGYRRGGLSRSSTTSNFSMTRIRSLSTAPSLRRSKIFMRSLYQMRRFSLSLHTWMVF